MRNIYCSKNLQYNCYARNGIQGIFNQKQKIHKKKFKPTLPAATPSTSSPTRECRLSADRSISFVFMEVDITQLSVLHTVLLHSRTK